MTRRRLSRCCQEATTPSEHAPCTGCDCEHHDVPVTAVHTDGLRGLIEATTEGATE